jgi:ATP-dependent DNA helicase RecG
MTISNANRADSHGLITPDDFEPNPKNPNIAAFFRNIGLADELGSGVRNLYNYVPKYSGKAPELIDGDIFKIIVPLDDDYSFDVELNKAQNKAQFKAQLKLEDCSLAEQLILEFLSNNPDATQADTAKAIDKSRTSVQEAISKLKDMGLLEREGAKKNGRWIVKL